MVVVPAAIEGVALAVAAVPFLQHRWDMHRWERDHLDGHAPKTDGHAEPLTVLLPVWNEATVIKEKLINLAGQDVALSLLIIDSASTDPTLDIARSWLAEHPEAFASSEILEMSERKGKTAAVIQALKHLGTSREGLVCMTDADAMLESGVLKRLMQWFADPIVGAVGAVPKRLDARKEERLHRTAWEAMRVAESSVDSTPFLEGSCMMWRPSCLAIEDLLPTANADDAQIATSIRCRGWRTLTDPMAMFTDAAPRTAENQRRQKIRRAQGLQRLLVRERKRAGAAGQGVFGRIVRRQHHFHIVAPLALTVALICAILRWGFIGLYGWPATFTWPTAFTSDSACLKRRARCFWWRARRGSPTACSRYRASGWPAWNFSAAR